MNDRSALILLAAIQATLTAGLAAAAAGYLARRDHATWPQAITRAGTTFAAALTLAAALTETIHTLIN